jgi:hypothetical protein
MGFFNSKPQPQPRPHAERIEAFRRAVFAAQQEHDIGGSDLINALSGIIDTTKIAATFATPLPSRPNKFKLPPGLRQPEEPRRSLCDIIAGR